VRSLLTLIVSARISGCGFQFFWMLAPFFSRHSRLGVFTLPLLSSAPLFPLFYLAIGVCQPHPQVDYTLAVSSTFQKPPERLHKFFH